MKKIIKKLMVLLDGRQKRIMVLLVSLMLIGAVLETLGVSLVIPVMNVVMDEHAVENNKYLQVICDILRIEYNDTRKLMIFTMLALIGVFVVKNIFLFIQQKAQLRFVYTNQFATSRRMMINFMERPYEYYLNADTSVIQRSITSDVNNMYGLILALLQLFSEAIVFVCLVLVSLATDVWMTVTVTLLLVVVLAIIKGILKPIMKKAGEENQDYYSGLFKWISQTVLGIKEVKGYFQLNTSPNSMTVSTMRLMFLENIQLLRMHRMKPDPNTQGQSHDSIQIRGGANAPVGQPLQPSPSNKPAVPANLPSSALRRP